MLVELIPTLCAGRYCVDYIIQKFSLKLRSVFGITYQTSIQRKNSGLTQHHIEIESKWILNEYPHIENHLINIIIIKVTKNTVKYDYNLIIKEFLSNFYLT